eukprot:TRINITY_DN1834_c0_g1_i3.p1 TRINITY_DN1834_c0_g1~~TRINITY_DN1834_c0_g1_i3.p1  ORF type:complete len:363 (+),score=69.02 TRINITY_DN1834_c0_g1_i3:226-1314(+)
MAESERLGDKFFIDEEYDKAVAAYTDAITENPSDPSLFYRRAAANLKIGDTAAYRGAVADANKVIELEPKFKKAHLRKGIACFNLEEYETAKEAFEAGNEIEPSDEYRKWIRKCEAEIEDELASRSTGQEECSPVSSAPEPASPVDMPVAPPPQAPGSKTPRFRHEFYQSDKYVVVTILAKGLKPDQLQVDYGEQMLRVVIKMPDGDDFCLQERLFAKIHPDQSNHRLLGTKVEIKLIKAEAIQWKALDYSARTAVLQPVNVSNAAKPVPKYPSSSRRTHDWDKMVVDIKKQEKDEKLDGDAALNKLFQDIYANADEDSRRAMNKSFQESNGTVLSTNWKEIGQKKVDSTPPTGMEVKDFEY